MALTYGLREAEATFWKKSVHDLKIKGSLGKWPQNGDRAQPGFGDIGAAVPVTAIGSQREDLFSTVRLEAIVHVHAATAQRLVERREH